MAENSKLEKTEIEEIKNIQTKYLQIQQGIGQIRVSLIKLEQQKELLIGAENDLNSQFVDAQKNEQEFVKSLSDKYGNGTLDLDNELFIPNS